jgi:Calcineurin-like phosphoesterase/Bacterial Ig domain
MRGLRRRTALLAAIGTAVGAQLLGASPSSAVSTCVNTKSVASGVPYDITVCIDIPTPGATVSGTTEITATATLNAPTTAVLDRMVFFSGATTPTATYLLADHDAPYRMVLDTTRYPNGSNAFSARPVFVGGAVPTRASVQVSIDNPAQPPDDETFTPWLGGPKEPGERFRLALVGDGVDGSPESHGVSAVVAAAHPDAFAYLGDVYDRGTPSEFDTWYEDPVSFGQFVDITNPTIGNHEYMMSATAEPYFEYWHQIPHYYSYDVGAWHIVSIDSNTEFGQLGVNSAQYKWLKDDIEANTDRCTLLYAHHARLTNVNGVSRTGLEPEWDLMVDRGGDIILGGHAHTYERWLPLDGDQAPVTEGLTEFVVGTGGRPILNEKHPEPRTAADITTPGALLLDLGDTEAGYTFVSADGQYTDTGTLPCRTAPAVEPEITSTLPGDNAWARGDVSIHWKVTDPESPDTLTTVGCEDVLIDADQPETTYTCTARSGGGLTGRSVTVKRDGTPPVVTTVADPAEPDGTNDWYVTAPTVSFTCTDALADVAECPDPAQAGEGAASTVTGTARDNAGNTADATYGPVKVDLTDPTVDCDDRVTYLLHQTGTLVGADVADTPSGPLRAREVLAVHTETVGDQTITVTGTDVAGRTGSDVCDYRVIYGFSGFQPPVNGSAAAVNVVKAGKVVPLKWLLADAAGIPVTSLGSVRVSTVSHSCTTTAGGVQDPVDETAVGGSGLQNFGDGSYQYNWRAPTSYAGSCRTVRLDLGDDLLRTVEFRFTG